MVGIFIEVPNIITYLKSFEINKFSKFYEIIFNFLNIVKLIKKIQTEGKVTKKPFLQNSLFGTLNENHKRLVI